MYLCSESNFKAFKTFYSYKSILDSNWTSQKHLNKRLPVVSWRTIFLAFSAPGAPDVVALLDRTGSATSGWLRQLREQDLPTVAPFGE